jgi:predicted Zn-dependent peptidase
MLGESTPRLIAMGTHTAMVAAPRNIRKHVLPNGVTILSEEMQGIRSVAIGVWLKTGSRHEQPETNGISHFIEHMVFKGTKSRSALDIARQMDSIGGNMDAFTGKETICFNAKVLDEHLPIAVDVITDLVLNPTFDPKDIDREKGVILEEIKMDEDNPDYLVHEIFTQNFWKDHPLGRPILGTRETVKAFNQAAILDNFTNRFSPGSIVISAAGSLNHEQFVALISDRFSQLKPVPNGHHHPAPKVTAKIITKNKKSLEQVQLCMGVAAPYINHEKRYVSYVMNTLLGGGMSSRLFQKVREEQGLVYSIYSDLNPYSDTGALCVYAGTSRDSAPNVVQSVLDEFKRLKAELIGADELERVKDQLKGSLMLSLESSTSRMSNLARQDMYFDRFIDQDEIIRRVEQVTSEEVCGLANEIFQSDKIAVTLLGNLNGLKLPRTALRC